ncbi:MAG TPA: PH domain-containing protein [Chloroflexia bacterium]|nr:PH domain-containing protein [Chloroflexia bacterium]
MSFQIEYDSKGQMERIQGMVVQGEVLYAVFDLKGGGSGFVGITDRRLIFMDQAIFRKKRSLVSLPYSKITAVASEDSGGIIFGTSTLLVIAGSREFEFDFRSNEKAHRAYELIMWNLLQGEKPLMMRQAQ